MERLLKNGSGGDGSAVLSRTAELVKNSVVENRPAPAPAPALKCFIVNA